MPSPISRRRYVTWASLRSRSRLMSVILQLDNVRDRVDEIESLHRTSELTVKKENDLGGILRLRMGQLSKGPSQVEEGDGVDESEAPIRLV